ncbi:hypothetical protein [Nocardia sp. NRRL S-836]|uniref:hypothetical protein n=1 Tax=Nocardia sp. NRRL S-836 TaxID=1519492 RepID=UPI000A54B444|nr:hypothetical protein [Nocardia sp. NRRL S-836]
MTFALADGEDTTKAAGNGKAAVPVTDNAVSADFFMGVPPSGSEGNTVAAASSD